MLQLDIDKELWYDLWFKPFLLVYKKIDHTQRFPDMQQSSQHQGASELLNW